MKTITLGFTVAMLLLMGAGCTLPNLPELPFLAKDLAATEIALGIGSKVTLEQTSINPLERLNDQPDRVITVTDWGGHDRVSFSWTETFDRETADSITAREAAERSTAVGEQPNIPEQIYETISLTGTVSSDALDDGDRILLPAAWPESEIDLSGTSNTIIWLSKLQYEELSSTRHTHLSIGFVDAGLQTAADAVKVVKNVIEKFTGSGDSTVTDQDITEITAQADWGKHTLLWNGEKVSVQTIEAENQFAKYTILANPDNPMILEVELKTWAYGTTVLGVLNDDLNILGYQVNSISLLN